MTKSALVKEMQSADTDKAKYWRDQHLEVLSGGCIEGVVVLQMDVRLDDALLGILVPVQRYGPSHLQSSRYATCRRHAC